MNMAAGIDQHNTIKRVASSSFPFVDIACRVLLQQPLTEESARDHTSDDGKFIFFFSPFLALVPRSSWEKTRQKVSWSRSIFLASPPPAGANKQKNQPQKMKTGQQHPDPLHKTNEWGFRTPEDASRGLQFPGGASHE